jgi:hypothetical protein
MITFRVFCRTLTILQLAVGCYLPTHGQSQVPGLVLDTDSIPLPYVNIGIPHAHIGTVSRDDGSFLLCVADSIRVDTVWFSCVGYHSVKIPFADLFRSGGKKNIVMEKMEVSLPEAYVFRRKPRIRKIGTVTQNPFVSGIVTKPNTDDIVEHAKLIKIRKPSLLTEACIFF